MPDLDPATPENLPSQDKSQSAGVGPRSKRLEKMRDNPRNDWTIEDIEKVCRDLGINCSPPTSGSHYKVSSEHLAGALPIPRNRPIKPIYIKKLLNLADAHMQVAGKGSSHDK